MSDRWRMYQRRSKIGMYSIEIVFVLQSWEYMLLIRFYRHPGSDNKVLDLLHPSLFPLAYGTTKVLPQGTVPLRNSGAFINQGVLAVGPNMQTITKTQAWGNDTNLKAWGNFQWLPSNVEFKKDGRVEITSYINNLEFEKHERLYKVLEQFVDRSIPLWNEALSWFHDRVRIPITDGSDEDYYIPEGFEFEDDLGAEHLDEEEWEKEERLSENEDYQTWLKDTRILKQHEPRDFVPFAEYAKDKTPEKGASLVDLREKFAKTGLQVIFKLANM